ncbi:hypothetical protein CDAR_602571 [Caerostris darwini]|uniref:Uncharacterized protein n=1 Tax=Caerostris darwini TaxID=1538125 RepID=A0AAV4TQT3_9ARAC|nr:hypothetical protein CDAR_602571 [Caerostris darwini]
MACILIISDATDLTTSHERLAIRSIFTKGRAFLWPRGTNTPFPEERHPFDAQAPSISLINSHLRCAPVCISVALRSKINVIGLGEVNWS